MVIKKITVNSKDYKIKELDFNSICNIEELGLSVDLFQKNKMTGIRALVAYHTDLTADEAGKEIAEHLKNGGSFNDFVPLIEDFSSFFLSLQKQQEEQTETATSKRTVSAEKE